MTSTHEMPKAPPGFLELRTSPAPGLQVTHLLRVTTGYPERSGARHTLCGKSRFDTQTPDGLAKADIGGWGVGGSGVSGPGVRQDRCLDCWSKSLTLCLIPPLDWHCTRLRGHDGPCAGVPYDRTKPLDEQGRYRPPSVIEGTVAPGLIDELRRLGDEYGPAGVIATAVDMWKWPRPDLPASAPEGVLYLDDPDDPRHPLHMPTPSRPDPGIPEKRGTPPPANPNVHERRPDGRTRTTIGLIPIDIEHIGLLRWEATIHVPPDEDTPDGVTASIVIRRRTRRTLHRDATHTAKIFLRYRTP